MFGGRAAWGARSRVVRAPTRMVRACDSQCTIPSSAAITATRTTYRVIGRVHRMRKFVLGLIGVCAIALLLGNVLGVFPAVVIVEQDATERAFIFHDVSGPDARLTDSIMSNLDAFMRERGDIARRPLRVYSPDGRMQVGFEMNPSAAALLDAGWIEGKRRVIPAGRYLVAEMPLNSRLPLAVRLFWVRRALAAYRASHRYLEADLLTAQDDSVLRFWQPIVARP